ncbi:MAG: DegV family protein [Lachnospiraceae bacterium]|nr:DegV family protein [Lachnospiraceae bacterium]
MNYEIISDLSIDIDADFARAHQVGYLPMNFSVGEETLCCSEPATAEAMHTYYDQLRAKVPTSTSQITPYQYEQFFTPYLEQGKAILYISLSSGLSRTYEAALHAANTLKERFPEAQIEVVDSLGATGGMGLLTESACLNRENGMSLEENAQWLRQRASYINYYFKVEDLMYLKRGGRISATTAVMGTALQIRPILTIAGDGSLSTIAKKRGKNASMQYLLDQLCASFDPSISEVVYISCADCVSDAEKLKSMVLEKLPQAQVKITSLSPIIGAHTGPDMLAIIYYGAKRV